MNPVSNSQLESPWPHRFAMLLAAVTFPLIWVGGLVTTYDAGMAVPDWPATYGYNLFLYPLGTWVGGPWDLFIEHGHRLLGSLAGLITIGLLITALRFERRRWVQALCGMALLLVIAQGTLGGIRVLAVDRAIAKVHGCVGPAFLALAVAIAVVTSRWWVERAEHIHRVSRTAWLLSVIVVGLAYLQLVLGANLRHISVESDPVVFRAIVVFHILGALLAWGHGLWLWLLVSWHRPDPSIIRPVRGLGVLLSLQVVLGAGTWVVKYGWPAALAQTYAWAGTTVEAKSMLQANMITAHVAVGSLIIATSVWVCLRLARVREPLVYPESVPSGKGVTA